MVCTRSASAPSPTDLSTKKRAAPAPADGPSPKRAALPGSASSDASDDSPRDVAIAAHNTFHGQLRLMAGARLPVAGRPAERKMWGSCLLTTQAHLGRFLDAVNDVSYSKTSGKGGAPLAVPIKRARPQWGRQAVLVVVSRAPFATHKLSIEQRGPGEYWALAGLQEKRQLAAPSGLGSFDACLFDLTDGESSAVTMRLQGKGDYLISRPCETLPNGPEWE